MKFHQATCILGAFAAAAAINIAASGATIGVSFSRDGDLGVQSSEMEPADLAGAPGVRVANWNNYYFLDPDGGSAGDGSLEPAGGVLGDNETIVDDSASAVAGFQAALTIGSGGIFDRVNGSHINDMEMYNGVLDTFDTAANTVAVSGIPYSTYDVYVYMFNDGAERAGKFTIGGTSYWARGGQPNPLDDGTGYILSSDTNPAGLGLGAIDQGNYVKFTGLTSSSFTLEAIAVIPSGSSQSISRNKVAGFQIVSAVPEPATLLHVALGVCVSFLTIGRRRP